MTPSEVELHIGELVFTGFAPDEAAALADGLQAELGRLLAGEAPPGAGADLAAGVAEAVYRQLGW